MNVIKSERVIGCDIDDTLIMHDFDVLNPLLTAALIKDPLDETRQIRLRVNLNMVRLVKEERQRGSTVIFWSRGGHQWVANVVEALGLMEKDTIIMTKPLTYFDDSPVENWMKDRVYIGPDEAYKKHIVTNK